MADESNSKKTKLEVNPFDLSSTNLSVSANFPNEVWLKILGYLSTYEILREVALVNKYFNNLTKDSFLLKKIHVRINRLNYSSAKDAYETIQNSRNLIELVISHEYGEWDWNRFSPGFFICIALKSCPKLYILKLKIENCRLSENGARHILLNIGLDKNKSFDSANGIVNDIKVNKEVNVEKLELIKKGFQLLKLGTNFNMDMLNFENSITVDNIEYEPSDIYLRAISMNFENLQCLDISELIGFRDQTILSLLKEMANSLKSLKLPNCWLRHKGWQTEENWNKVQKSSIEILQNFQQLNELQISNYVSIMSRQLFYYDILSLVLSKLPYLKKLIVEVDHYDTNTYLINNNFEHLEWLELRVKQVHLSKFFLIGITIHCQNLETLIIDGADDLKHDDLDCINKRLTRLTKLRCFRIKNCKKITKEYFENKFVNIGIFEE